MLQKLAELLLHTWETPVEEGRAWRSRLAAGDLSVIKEAYYNGLTDGILGTSVDEVYISTSRIGEELGMALLNSLKEHV